MVKGQTKRRVAAPVMTCHMKFIETEAIHQGDAITRFRSF
jgi:hypothetical protein